MYPCMPIRKEPAGLNRKQAPGRERSPYQRRSLGTGRVTSARGGSRGGSVIALDHQAISPAMLGLIERAIGSLEPHGRGFAAFERGQARRKPTLDVGARARHVSMRSAM